MVFVKSGVHGKLALALTCIEFVGIKALISMHTNLYQDNKQ